MIFYLPYDDPNMCAKVLDDKLLQWHTLSCHHAVMSILGKWPQLKNHSGVMIWQDHVDALAVITMAGALELRARGEPSAWKQYLIGLQGLVPGYDDAWPEFPPCWGTAWFHVAHRSMLIHLDPSYRQVFKQVMPEPETEEIWPDLTEV